MGFELCSDILYLIYPYTSSYLRLNSFLIFSISPHPHLSSSDEFTVQLFVRPSGTVRPLSLAVIGALCKIIKKCVAFSVEVAFVAGSMFASVL